MKKTLFLLGLMPLSLLANPLAPKNFVEPTPQEYQKDKGQYKDLETNQFFLNLNPNDIKEVQKKEKEIQEAFDGFTHKEINYKPLIRPISAMDTINLHPYFTFTLLLPSGSIISHIDSSEPMAVMKYENNAILFRPNANFKIANITILYKLHEKNQILNVLARRYEKIGGDKLNLIYSYLDIKKRDNLEVLKYFIQENGGYPNQKYSYIDIDGISYRIVEDNLHGNVFLSNNKKYRIDNNVIYK